MRCPSSATIYRFHITFRCPTFCFCQRIKKKCEHKALLNKLKELENRIKKLEKEQNKNKQYCNCKTTCATRMYLRLQNTYNIAVGNWNFDRNRK
ncbi:hypothetical protein PUN28_010472 [Cardiocondyla obscurior]|uniref:SWIM-type domain-containing protein n=1 Tax=Cardiocondyla obscurior TaxID=286306 RepID=A0AAW2FG45_9HYME